MLTVTFCAHDGPQQVGGPDSWILRLFPLLRQQGIEVNCLFLLWGGAGPTLKALRELGFDCPAIQCPEFSAERVHWILNELSKKPPDVFVPNTVVAGYLAIKWIKSASIPTIGVLHSNSKQVEELLDVFVFGRNDFRLDATVCVSKELEELVHVGRPRKTITRRIPCGVPIPAIPTRTRSDSLKLVYLGRLTEEAKKISEVTYAMCKAVREVPGTEAVIYGDGPERNRVIGIIADSRQRELVRYGGVLESSLVQKELMTCDVIILLSDYEGLPVVIMEAMAVGVVPVCLKNCAGISELVVDGVNGMLVDDRADSFISAIRDLRNHPDLLNNMSIAAREKVTAEYAIEDSSEKWVDLLKLARGTSDNDKKPFKVPKKPKLGRKLMFLSDPRPLKEPAALRLYRRTRMMAGKIKQQVLKKNSF